MLRSIPRRWAGAVGAGTLLLGGVVAGIVATGVSASAATLSISPVGSLSQTDYGSGGTTLSVSPQAPGDVLVVSVDSHFASPLVSISGGGVTAWNRAVQFVSARGHDLELWYGTVSSAGSQTVTFNWPAPGDSGYWTEYTAQEFSSSYGTRSIWAVDGTQATGVNEASSSTVPFPTLTPSGTGDLYYGYAGMPGLASSGTTPGFTYGITVGGNVTCYDTAVDAAVSPSASQTPAGPSEAVGALVAVSGATVAPSVSSVSPSSGSTQGGTAVVITGAGFTGATSVTFGSTPAQSFAVNSDSSLTAVSPAGSPGTVDVAVTGPGGTSSEGASDRFTYVNLATVFAVGNLSQTDYGSGGATFGVTPQNIGDVLVVSIDSHFGLGGVTAVTGGGVTTWNRAVQFVSARGHDIELWYGMVTSPGAQTVAFDWPAPGDGGYWTEYTAQEFSSSYGSRSVWSVDGTQAASVNGPVSSTVPFPTLTPSGTGDLYYGYAGMPGLASAGTTPGFTYGLTIGGNVTCYDTYVVGTQSPTASQVPAGLSEGVAALLEATMSSITVPGAPSGLTANSGPSGVNLTWNAPSSNGGSAVIGYNVYEGTSPGHESTVPVNGNTLVTATTFTVRGLRSFGSYYFVVKAVNAAGSSSPSNEARVLSF